MPLYSTEIPTSVQRDNVYNEPAPLSGPVVEPCTWSYLFVHHAKVNPVNDKLCRQYPTFIHTHIAYKRQGGKVTKAEKPTISGLLFIQGHPKQIQEFLNRNCPGLWLVKDCSTHEVATIRDSVMQPFMKVASFNPTRIRFMAHTMDYYAVGNPLIRITSGALAGMEGFRIRIARDKCFITSLGGMTVAIGGIYKESFENLDEYVRVRRSQLKENRLDLTPVQTDIAKGFFPPKEQLDVLAIAHRAAPWILQAQDRLSAKRFDDATEILLYLLEEIGACFTPVASSPDLDLKDIQSLVEQDVTLLDTLLNSPDVSVDLKKIIESNRESLSIRYSFLDV